MRNIRIIKDFDKLIIVLKVWLSSLKERYFLLILQIAPFPVLLRPFYDIGPFERHAIFANFLVSTIFQEHYAHKITRQA